MADTDWYPIALGADIPENATRAVRLDGKELVIWRGGDGAVHVWEDRCPHRGMRLSYGFVRDNALNCLYHGWQYSAAGPCVRIPAHPDLVVPKTIRPLTYAAHENLGFVWVGFDKDQAIPAEEVAEPVISVAIERPQSAVIAAMLTLTHIGADGAPGKVSGQVPMLRIDFPASTVFAATHAVSAEKSMLHISVSGDAATPIRKYFADATRALRDIVEATPLRQTA